MTTPKKQPARSWQPNLRLKAWRTKKKFKQREAAELLDIRPGYYSALESGQPIPVYIYERLNAYGYRDSDLPDDNDPAESPVFGELVAVTIINPAYFRNPKDPTALSSDKVNIPSTLAKLGSFAWRIPNDDDSMMPDYRPMDTLIFSTKPPMLAGHKYLILDGEKLLTRKLVWQNDTWMLIASNPDKTRHPDEPLGSRMVVALILGFYRKEVDLETVQASKDGMR
jgi:transcriptional regulator with XRE-family HTH domain